VQSDAENLFLRKMRLVKGVKMKNVIIKIKNKEWGYKKTYDAPVNGFCVVTKTTESTDDLEVQWECIPRVIRKGLEVAAKRVQPHRLKSFLYAEDIGSMLESIVSIKFTDYPMTDEELLEEFHSIFQKTFLVSRKFFWDKDIWVDREDRLNHQILREFESLKNADGEYPSALIRAIFEGWKEELEELIVNALYNGALTLKE
jgi:hypothetical protein